MGQGGAGGQHQGGLGPFHTNDGNCRRLTSAPKRLESPRLVAIEQTPHPLSVL
jgi:hypothetical protein